MPEIESLNQFVDLIDQALDETFDLKAAIEFDEEYMGDALNFIEKLENDLRFLKSSIADGSYRSTQDDLPFMEIVNKSGTHILPFKHLLTIINESHKNNNLVQ